MNIKKNNLEPENFKNELTSVWSFPERGDWATHNSKYRGNFAPQVARNLIEKYTVEEENVLDPMVGSGTTLIEAKLLNRNALGVDINPNAIELSTKALDFEYKSKSKQKAKLADARNLDFCKSESVDLIIFHPPYLNIVEYSKGTIDGDLSNIGNIEKFCVEIDIVAKELYRVLKPGKHCAVLIGDTRKAQHYIPLSYYVFQTFLENNFILKEEVIKAQHNCSFSRKWSNSAQKYGFFLIMHEHLFIFRKPKKGEVLSKFKWSMKQKNKN
ncbi:MAG: DNA methyltransferase [Ignavibacteria bacterium]